MKIKYRNVRLNKANKQRLEIINKIIEEYQADGYKLTLRQLYYQLVSRDIVPNKQAEYSKLSTLLKEGRMGGIVDWNAIEDRLRKPSSPASFDSPKDILRAAINQYALPRMKGQPNYVEVWVEKDALSGVLSRVTKKYHVPILVNRGYSSASAMYDAFERFKDAMEENEEIENTCVTILYLGDFDPSGMDMIRDINGRIGEFFNGSKYFYNKWSDLDPEIQNEYIRTTEVDLNELDHMEIDERGKSAYFNEWFKQNFKVIPIALTKEQIKKYNPPPNPAKRTDPRAKEFIKKHGGTSWEVDALPPNVLHKLLEKSIIENIDLEKYESIVSKEAADKKKLEKLMDKL